MYKFNCGFGVAILFYVVIVEAAYALQILALCPNRSLETYFLNL